MTSYTAEIPGTRPYVERAGDGPALPPIPGGHVPYLRHLEESTTTLTTTLEGFAA